jgi:hypothetical protein
MRGCWWSGAGERWPTGIQQQRGGSGVFLLKKERMRQEEWIEGGN